jgi:hypothetical protein
MTDLGPIKRYLGVSFETLSLGIFLHQQEYAQSILIDFGMTNCRPAKISMLKGMILIPIC